MRRSRPVLVLLFVLALVTAACEQKTEEPAENTGKPAPAEGEGEAVPSEGEAAEGEAAEGEAAEGEAAEGEAAEGEAAEGEAAEGEANAAVPTELTRVSTSAGDLVVTPLQHASMLLQWGDVVIAVDPVAGAYEKSPAAETAPKADLVLVTDFHGDHLDADQVAAVRKEGAPVIAPETSAADITDPTILKNGETKTVLDDIEVTAVPMYNLEENKRTRPDTGELFHVPGRGNGYLVKRGETTIYISGDTECTPEMKALKDVDVAFVCMNLPYTMPLEEAVTCVEAFQPKVVYPYHHRGQNPLTFQSKLVAQQNIDVRVLDWYPASDDPTGADPEPDAPAKAE